MSLLPCRALVSVSVSVFVSFAMSVSVSVFVHWDTWHMGDAWGASDQQVSATLGSWGLGVVGVDDRVVSWSSVVSMVRCWCRSVVSWCWSVVCWLGISVSHGSGDDGEENQSDDLVHDDCCWLIVGWNHLEYSALTDA